MGSFLLSAGEKGKRYSLPNSRIMVHQPSAGFQGQATDIQIHAKEILSLKERLNKIYSKHTHIHQGSLNPEILIVNDFPNSEEEDQSNNILAEDCKELLIKMLGAINVELKENTIINTFFWRTPGDRRPTSNEIDKCRPFFYKIIELLAPKYIISLGDLALSVLMESEVNFIDSRGKTLNNKKMNIPIFPLFHPRVLIKQPSLKRLAWEDLKIIANEIK